MTAITRRTMISLLMGTAVVPLISVSAKADDCEWLNRAIADVDNDLANLDAWVATQGPAYVAKLDGTLAYIEQKTQGAGAVLDDKDAALIIDAFGTALSTGLFIAGLVWGVPVASTTILISVGVSATLLAIKAIIAPTSIDPVDVLVMQTVGDIDRVLEGAGDVKGFAYRSQAELAGKIFGFCSLVAEFYQLYNANASRDELEQKIQELRQEAIRVKSDLVALRQPGNLRAFREESLQELRSFLTTLSQGCGPTVPLP